MGDYTLVRALVDGRINVSAAPMPTVQAEIKELLQERDSLQSQLDEANADLREVRECNRGLAMEICNAREQADSMTGQCRRLREALEIAATFALRNPAYSHEEMVKVLAETPKQSLAEIEARAIENAADELTQIIYGGGRTLIRHSDLIDYANRLRQQAKEETLPGKGEI